MAVFILGMLLFTILKKNPSMGTIKDKVFDAVLERARLFLSHWLLAIWVFVLGI